MALAYVALLGYQPSGVDTYPSYLALPSDVQRLFVEWSLLIGQATAKDRPII